MANSTSNERSELTLFRAYRATRDLALRDKLVCGNLPLVHALAYRYAGLGESLDDLIQEGSIGLLHAVDHFDPERGVKFATYACYLITRQIHRYLRDRGHLIRQPAWLQELDRKVARTIEELRQELGCEPSISQIADRMNVTEETVREIKAAHLVSQVVSLTAPSDSDSDNELLLIDKEKVQERKLQTLQLPIEDRIVLEEAIDGLKLLERKVIKLFFFGGFNRTEIAKQLGISVSYSAYLLDKSIEKLRAGIDESPQVEEPVKTKRKRREKQAQVDGSLHAGELEIDSGSAFLAGLVARTGEAASEPFTLLLVEVDGLEETGRDVPTTLAAITRLIRSFDPLLQQVACLEDQRFAMGTSLTGDRARQLGKALYNLLSANFAADGDDSAISFRVGAAAFPEDGQDARILMEHAVRSLATGSPCREFTSVSAHQRLRNATANTARSS